MIRLPDAPWAPTTYHKTPTANVRIGVGDDPCDPEELTADELRDLADDLRAAAARLDELEDAWREAGIPHTWEERYIECVSEGLIGFLAGGREVLEPGPLPNRHHYEPPG